MQMLLGTALMLVCAMVAALGFVILAFSWLAGFDTALGGLMTGGGILGALAGVLIVGAAKT